MEQQTEEVGAELSREAKARIASKAQAAAHAALKADNLYDYQYHYQLAKERLTREELERARPAGGV